MRFPRTATRFATSTRCWRKSDSSSPRSRRFGRRRASCAMRRKSARSPRSMEPDMASLVETFLKRVIREGDLEVERASGVRSRVGDGGGGSVAVRFADKAAERALLLNPALALGELYMNGRLAVTRGSIYAL